MYSYLKFCSPCISVHNFVSIVIIFLHKDDVVSGTKMATYRKSFEAKGKSGEHKRYFSGKYPKSSKRKKTIQFSEGEQVIFRKDSNILVGYVKEKVKNGYYMIAPTENCTASEEYFVISNSNEPISTTTLKINEDLQCLQNVLTVWEFSCDYLTLIPAKVFQIRSESDIWVKPSCQIYEHAVKVEKNDICSNPYLDTHIQIEVNNRVDAGDVAFLSGMLKLTQRELETVQASYDVTLQNLIQANKKKEFAEMSFRNLKSLYLQTTNVVKELRKSLQNVHSSNAKRVTTLVNIISKQKITVDDYERQMFVLHNELMHLQKSFQEQEQKLNGRAIKWRGDRRKMKNLLQENENLKAQNATLSKNQIYVGQNVMEIRPSTSAERTSLGVVMTRKLGSTKRPSAFIPITLPDVSSAEASGRSLENRAKQLKQILEVIACQNTSTTDEDIVAVLVEYFRRNPKILSLTAEQNKSLLTIKELSPASAADLKILLRLPMNKLRMLRTLLKNAGVNIIPSEKSIYQELVERRKAYDGGSLEVGAVSMKQRAGSADESEVAFVRVKSLEDHLHRSIRRHHSAPSFSTNGSYKGKLWIKVGGDKGGNSTKLGLQVVNSDNCNSPDKTDIIGMYEAYDSIENLKAVFGSFTEDFITFQREGYTVSVGESNYPLHVFLFGDYEFLCKAVGHMGASAAYPCLWCYTKLSDLCNNNGPHTPMLWNEETQTFHANPSWPAKRTVVDMQHDLVRNKEDPRRGGDLRANGSNHHSIAHDPVLPIVTHVDHIIPPSLHILLGLVVRYYKYLETYCRSLDHSSLGERNEELFKEWEEASSLTKTTEVNYLRLRDCVREEEEMLKTFKRANSNGNVQPRNVRCSLPICVVSASDISGNVEWIQCVQCGVDEDSGWYHLSCLRLTEQTAASFSICPMCKGNVNDEDSVLTWQKELIAQRKQEMKTAKLTYDKAKSSLDSIYEKVLATRGPVEMRLNQILEKDVGVEKQAYHSQCFVGNHCKIILKEIDKLLVVIQDEVMKQKIGKLFKSLRDIFFFFEARFLSADEVNELCRLCWDLGRWFPVEFPEERIPPKLHFLIAHVPECAMAWGTIGLLGEHGLESVHATFNAEERVYACIRKKKERLLHIYNQHGQRSMVDKTLLSVVRRKCVIPDCDGRYKLLDGVRKCQKCGLSCDKM